MLTASDLFTHSLDKVASCTFCKTVKSCPLSQYWTYTRWTQLETGRKSQYKQTRALYATPCSNRCKSHPLPPLLGFVIHGMLHSYSLIGLLHPYAAAYIFCK